MRVNMQTHSNSVHQARACQNCKKDFIIDEADVSFYGKMNVPPPTFCPECRMIRRFHFRNERYLFRRPDTVSGKEIFSGFSPESPVRTLENSFWYSTGWDAFENGRAYDFSRPFFEQFRELLADAPLPARSVYNLLNSDYCNEASEVKNCYLCFNVDFAENSSYLRKCNRIKDSLDCYECTDDQLCYEGVMVDKSYQTYFSIDCESCVNVWFSKGLRGCTNCFGSVNLKNKSYYFFNEPCTKEEYEKNVSAYVLDSFSAITELKKKTRDFWSGFPVKYNHTLRTQHCTGERVFDSKNVIDSYSVSQGENLRYCQDIQPTAANSYDYSVWGSGSENIYECMTCGLGSFNLKFCFNCWGEAADLEYCVYTLSSKNCFGCVGLYKKEYCIFNMQYTKEEYFTLRQEIIAQMNMHPYMDQNGRIYRYGEFFPHEVSPTAYNESIAQDFFPLTKEAAEEKGYIWREMKQKEYEKTMKASELPDRLSDTPESIVSEIIECASCARAYRIIPNELGFYRQIGVSLPRLCMDCRFLGRFAFMNPPMLWHRSCMCTDLNHVHVGPCPNEFETSYSPERPDIVYCESCYQGEVG